MEDLNEIFTSKNITESSKKLYLANLLRLNGGQPIKNLKFLNDVEAIKEKLGKYKPNTQRSYIISVVSLMKSLKEKQPKKFSKLYDSYYAILDTMNKSLKDQTGKTEKEEKEWIGQDAVKEKFETQFKVLEELKDKKKLTSEEYEKLLHLVVLALFVLQKPRRNKDYQEAYITKKYKPELGTDKNFLDLFKNEFLFNQYKTQGKYAGQIVAVNPLLREIIDFYLKFHPLKAKLKEKDSIIPLLVDDKGEPFTQTNSLTRMLYKIFGSKIGSSMLRKLYLTDKYAEVMKEMKADAEQMATSTGTIQTNYVKKESETK
jgi:hypothetical protein